MEKYNYDFRVADHHKLTILSDSESEKKGSLSWRRNSYIRIVFNPIKYREHILTSAYELGYKNYDTNGESSQLELILTVNENSVRL